MDALDKLALEQKEWDRLFFAYLVLHPDEVRKKAARISPDDLVDQAIGEFWTRVYQGDDPSDVAVSLNMMPDLMKAMNALPPNMPLSRVLAGLNKSIALRQYALGGQDLVRAALDGDTNTAGVLVDVLRNTYAQSYTAQLQTPGELKADFLERVDDGDVTIPTYVQSMDTKLFGYERGTLVLKAARPGMGKSGLAYQTAEDQARAGYKVGYFQLEMKAIAMIARRVCPGIGKTWMDVRAGNITPEERTKLGELIDAYSKELSGLHITDATYWTAEQICELQRRERYDIIYIDHLNLMKGNPRRNERKDEYLGRISMMLKDLAKETNCVVVLLHQLNRGNTNRGDQRPHLQDLRDSGRLEENADVVLFLHRDSHYDHDDEVEGDMDPTQVIIAKFRDGKLGVAWIMYDLTSQRFTSMTAQDFDKMATERMEDSYEQRTLA